MTVAQVRDPRLYVETATATADSLEIAFLESARFYRLPIDHQDFERLLGLLESSRDGFEPVWIERSDEASATILSVAR